MKPKLLLLLLGGAFSAIGAWAQTTYDITDYTIVNPNPVYNTDGWTCSVKPGTFDPGNNCAEFWGQSGATMKQTIPDLPAGSYQLKVVALQREEQQGTIEANGQTIPIAKVSSATVNNRGQANTWFNEDNGVNTIDFTLTEPADVTIGINVDNANGDHWTVFRSFQLLTFDENVLTSYESEKNNAEALPEDGNMEAGKLYYFDIASSNKYTLSATALSDISFRCDLSYAAVRKWDNPIQVLLQSRYYVKSASAQTLTFDITPFVATNRIVNPNPVSTGNLDGWTCSGQEPEIKTSYNCVEYWWKHNSTIKQTLPNLPAGAYALKAVALQRRNSGVDATGTIEANGQTTTIVNTDMDDVGSVPAASTFFNNGNGMNIVFFTLEEPTDVTVGINVGNTTWVVFRSFELISYDTTLINDNAEALPGDGSMEADKWYYFDITSSDKYTLKADALSDIAYTTNGEQWVHNNGDTWSTPVQELTRGRYFVKSASAQTLTFTVVPSYDITDLITNPNPVSNTDGWECSVTPNASDATNNCIEFWQQSGATMRQTISELPAGSYCLRVVALQREGYQGTIMVNDRTIPIAQVASSTVNTRAQANTWFNQGNGVNTIFFTLDEPTDVTIGLTADNTTWDYWTVVRSFQLVTYDIVKEKAEALPDNKNMEAGKWYYFDAASSDRYTLTAETLNDIAYTVNGEQWEHRATTASWSEPVQELTRGRYFMKSASAQTLNVAVVPSYDITAYTIKNPNPVNDADEWTCSVDPNSFDPGNNCTEFYNQPGATLRQTISDLPAGSYCLRVVALQRSGYQGTIEVNNQSIPIIQATGINSRNQASEWFNKGNGVNVVYFTLNEKADVTVGITADNTTGDHWTVFRSFELVTYDKAIATFYMAPGYENVLNAAKEYLTQDMFDADKEVLRQAIADNTVEEPTAAAYQTAIENLNAAVAAAAKAVTKYAEYVNVVAAVEGRNNVNVSSCIANLDFESGNLTGWTSEQGGGVANNGNFTPTYFVERWQPGNSPLGSGSLTHEVIALPAGIYTFAVDAQNIEQYNTSAPGSGYFFCVNDQRTEIGVKGNYLQTMNLTEGEYSEVTIKMLLENCTGNWVSCDNITITFIAKDLDALKGLLSDELSTANGIDRTTNVGEGVFRIPAAAAASLNEAIAAAQNAYDNSNDATADNIYNALAALKEAQTAYLNAELNAPAADRKYYIEVATPGHPYENNPVMATHDGDYAFDVTKGTAAFRNQAFSFTKAEGNKYLISIERPEGTVYMTGGTRIGGTVNNESATAFKIVVSDIDGAFYIQNTETNTPLAAQTGGSLYPETGNAYFKVAEAPKADVSLTAKAGKYATRIFPFVPELPEGVKAYSCGATSGNTLTMEEVATPEANKPYILLNTNDEEISAATLSDYGMAETDDYTEGFLTGLYTAVPVAAGNYVLQTQNGVQGFYLLTAELKGTPYRAFLSVPSGIKAFFFEDTDGLTRIQDTDGTGKEVVYNLAGQRLTKAEKGINIINGKKVVVK